MILVDSSVWIQVLNHGAAGGYRHATYGEEVVTCLPVIQEVLQGIHDERAFRVAKAAFADIPVLEDPLTRAAFEEAVQLYRNARRSGFTIRSSVDCIIAVCALRNGATVLHLDRDFTHLARVSALKEQRLWAYEE